MYDRDGSVREAWYDPPGWTGLSQTPPPSEALQHTYDARSAILSRRAEAKEEVNNLEDELMALGVGLDAMRGHSHLESIFEDRQKRASELTKQIGEIRAKLTRETALLESLDAQAQRLNAGDRGPMRAHIGRAQLPIPPNEVRLGRIAEIWAAMSIGLAMIIMVFLIIFERESLGIGLAITVGAFLIIEAAFRRWLGQLVAFVTAVLTLVAAGILLVEFFWIIVVVLVVLVGGYLIWENLRELWT
jgi:hypothetical protein